MPASSYFRYVEGESVYGLVTNYHVGSTSRSWKETNKSIFGRTHVRLHPVLPNYIACIANHFNVDAQHLIRHSTGFPLYAFSLGDTASALADHMLAQNGRSMSRVSRQAPFALPLEKHHKYCPHCVAHSFNDSGKMTWLIEHQLYGVSICPIHGCSLEYIDAGEGGVNRKYVLPEGGRPLHTQNNEKALFLSRFVIALFKYLQVGQPAASLQSFYHSWLLSKDYLTARGNIRMKKLTRDLHLFWRPLFASHELSVPLELSNFSYVAHIVHARHPVHYLKHVMLMAFLTPAPETFFSFQYETPTSQNTTIRKSKFTPIKQADILSELKTGSSLQQVSRKYGLSVGFLKQLALRNRVPVKRRRQSISEAMERKIWCKAFVGQHRADIASQFSVSVGAIEQIIQSHAGLSLWRKHLRHADAKRHHRNMLQSLINARPHATRNEIKQSTSSYMWLYKHDKEWLYEHLPAAQSAKYHPSLDWAARDKILVIKMVHMVKPAASLSAIDRQLGGHAWLTHHASKLPMTLKAAHQKIEAYKKQLDGI